MPLGVEEAGGQPERMFSSGTHRLYFLCLLFLTLLPLVSFPEVLKSLAVINVNVDSSLNSQENISNLESLNQVFKS